MMFKSVVSGQWSVVSASLVLAVVLALLPASWTEMLKGRAAQIVKPGQTVVIELRDRIHENGRRVGAYFQSSARLAQAEIELADLHKQNDQMARELATFRTQANTRIQASTNQDQPLLHIAAVEARVLGRQSLAFLRERQMLDVGTRSGVHADALVAASAVPILDAGKDTRMVSGRLVLSGCRVWGRIAEVGQVTSTVQKITEAGYRDLVRLAGSSANTAAVGHGPEGILEGTGEPLVRIRNVPATEPVAVGDAVYAADLSAFPAPPLYGHVVRVERPVGAAHWEIWMQPAMVGESPDRVVILCSELRRK